MADVQTRAVIDAQNLCKTYMMGNQEVHALRGVSIAIDKGEMVAIVGASGSGKSTLMAILGTLDQPTTGSYRLDGIELADLDDDSLAAIRNWRIGFVFQQFNLLPRSSALANVALPLVYAGLSPRERREKAQYALEQVGLADRMDHKPTELSGGQQQRVAVARALVNNPTMVLADEPTGALDSKTSADLMNLFHHLNDENGITLVIVTHDPRVASQARRVITLSDGEIIEDSGHDNLLSADEPTQILTLEEVDDAEA